ncbi:hypothetical protein C4J81_10030 [Deltaproteobacteria bacterium Smac51]|nr:hypothetical protein C4J81_10030 [Deltaproteobacteria bacterium Smac51]
MAQYIANGNLGYTGNDNLNDNYFSSRLRIDVSFQATDEVSVHWRLESPSDQRWGDRDRRTAENVYYYGQVVQDWGTIRVGRLDGGADEFGLSTLGWAPTLDDEFVNFAPFEGSSEYDSIQYTNEWDNGFGLRASYSKIETEWRPGEERDHRSGDHDHDRFQVEGYYLWEGGGASLNVMYSRNALADGIGYDINDDPIYNDHGAEDKTTAWFINPAIMHSWGAFSAHFEGMFAWGETKFHNRNGLDAFGDPYDKVKDADADGAGFYLDLDYNYGPGRVNLAGWWVSGNDIGDKDNKAIVDIVDGNFYPLVAAYGYVGFNSAPTWDERTGENFGAVAIANNSSHFYSNSEIISIDANAALNGFSIGDDLAGDTGIVAGLTNAPRAFVDRTRFDNNSANHWAIMVSGQHGFTDEITFNYALGYLSLNHPNYRVMKSLDVNGAGAYTGASYHSQDKDLGWEIDLGFNIQLLDNLAFTTTFGYLITGDAFKTLKGYHASGDGAGNTNFKAKWEDADNVYTWVNSLTFSF